MSRTPRLLAVAIAFAAVLAFVDTSSAQKPFDDPVLERMRQDVFFLASPECEGRGIETKGIDKAADYIVDSFKASGLKPGMKDGSYFQPFKVPMASKLKKSAFTLTGPNDAKKEPKLNNEFSVLGYSPTSKMSGDLVFAGFGVSAPALKYDDYDGLNVEGKIVVILRRTPRYGQKGDKRFDKTVPDGQDSPHAFFDAKIEAAAKRKVGGLIIVNDTTAAKESDDRAIPFQIHASGTTPATFPVLFMNRALFDEILAANKQKSLKEIEETINDKLKPVAFELKGWKADAEVTVERREVACKNVVGILEGAGALKDETVVIGAHYDHVGYGLWGSADRKGSGKIHYGADDNASGTSGLMELARRFGAIKNRQGRRIVFIAFSAEEHGLDGSRFYCANPLFPLDKTAAMLNMDMIGRSKPVNVDYFGLFGKKEQLLIYGTGTGEGLSKLVDDTTKKFDFKITTRPGGTGPSDHDSFYRKGVPVLFLYTGQHPEYHKPTDVPEKINVAGMKKTTDFVEVLAKDVLTRETKPKYLVVVGGNDDPTDPRPRGPAGPRLGFAPGNYGAEDVGILVDAVTPGGVAEKAGIKDGDFIVEVAGQPTPNMQAYMKAMGAQKLGTTIDVVVDRKGKKLTLKAELK